MWATIAGRLDVDPHHATIGYFENQIDVGAVVITPMVERCLRVRPGRLAGDLPGDRVSRTGPALTAWTRAREATSGPIRCVASPESTRGHSGIAANDSSITAHSHDADMRRDESLPDDLDRDACARPAGQVADSGARHSDAAV